MSVGKLILTFACSVLLGGFLIGCNEKTERDARIHTKVTITDLTDSTFVTVTMVEKMDGLEIGRVIVQRTNRNGSHDLFSMLVVPIREIPPSSKVKVSVVEYPSSLFGNTMFFVVK